MKKWILDKAAWCVVAGTVGAILLFLLGVFAEVFRINAERLATVPTDYLWASLMLAGMAAWAVAVAWASERAKRRVK